MGYRSANVVFDNPSVRARAGFRIFFERAQQCRAENFYEWRKQSDFRGDVYSLAEYYEHTYRLVQSEVSDVHQSLADLDSAYLRPIDVRPVDQSVQLPADQHADFPVPDRAQQRTAQYNTSWPDSEYSRHEEFVFGRFPV